MCPVPMKSCMPTTLTFYPVHHSNKNKKLDPFKLYNKAYGVSLVICHTYLSNERLDMVTSCNIVVKQL